MLSSIKGRLALWFFIIFSIIFSSFGLFLYHNIEKVLIGSIDSHLHSEMQLIAGLLNMDRTEHNNGLSNAAVGEYARPLSGHYYQLTTKGKIIALSPSLATVGTSLPIHEQTEKPIYISTTGPDKGPLRVLTETFHLKTGVVTIQVGESLEETFHLLERSENIISLIFPAFFLISLAGIITITRSSLKKIDAFSNRVESITEKNLKERLDKNNVDKELKPLATSFNTMMGRIEESFDIQRRFLADASHDLKTPQAIIKSHCDVTLSKARDKNEYIESLETIRQNVEKMTALTNRILKVSELDSDTFILKKEDLNLAEIIASIVKTMEVKAGRNKVSIKISGDGDLMANGDKSMLTEMFSNIIDNAIKYNRENGLVDIELNHQEKEVLISIKDTGIGIADDKLGKIFDRFYRADESRSVTEGSGLGLSIVKSIIERHSGRIEVNSELGKGSSFLMYLPAS